jgi:hypothetical protein
LTGTYAATMYEDLVGSVVPDRDTRVASGRAFVDQKLSPRQSVSASYEYQVITAKLYGRTATQTVLVYDSWRLNPQMSISLFAGPQYSAVHSGSVAATIPLRTGWSWSAGGTFDWSGKMTAVSASVTRRVSDGGGIGGAVQLTSFSGNVSRRFGRAWTTNFFATYAMNGSNTGTLLPTSLRSFSGGFGVSREIIRNLSFDAKYWYSHDGQTSSLPLLGYLADHNRVTIGFSYKFARPLGN